ELAGSQSLAQLRALDISRNPIGSEGLIALARSPHLCNLRRLNLAHTNVGAQGIEEMLSPSAAWRQLSEVDLSGIRLPHWHRILLQTRFRGRLVADWRA